MPTQSHRPESLVRAATPYLEDIVFVAYELNRQGWAEANAGNFSVLLDSPRELAGPAIPLSRPVPSLASRTLLITGAGVQLRRLGSDPLPGLCLVTLDDRGAAYRAAGNVRPSSELAVHLAGHDVLSAERPSHHVLLHAHPTHVTALSLLYPEPESLVALLAASHSEAAAIRSAVGALPFIEPGSQPLADATATTLRNNRGVIWSRHGMLASGVGFDEALDIIELCDKSAQLALLSGRTPRPARSAPAPARSRSLHGRPAPDGAETFYDVRSLDSSLSPEELRALPRRPVRLVLDNLRSAFNVGSIFRLADAARVEQVVTCGYTASPPNLKLEQTALGTTAVVPWKRCATTVEAVERLKDEGMRVVALETGAGAVPYHRFDPRFPLALVLGNESFGVSQSVLRACDAVVDIPVAGLKNSINVAAAAAVVLYHFLAVGDWLDRDDDTAGR